MIDFTKLPRKRKSYAGANGSKIAVVYDGAQYMLKFPPPPSKNKELSYTNSCISEYIACHIFESVGIPVQETLLGTYTVNGKEKVCVACRDFTSVGVVLQDFASLKNQIIDSERNGYGTELADILKTFEEQQVIDHRELEERFWDMFVVDALIGNWDRHNGNWGFLYDTQDDSVSLAPVFDCGSSLYPQADDGIMQKVLEDRNELNFRVFEIPTSSIMQNGKRINYHRFLTAGEYAGCNAALGRIMPRIDMARIVGIVRATPYTSELQKEFYATMLRARYDHILEPSLVMAQRLEQRQPPMEMKM